MKRWLIVMGAGVFTLILFINTGLGGASSDAPELKTSKSGVQYHLALPKGWDPNRTWPILVTIEASGHHFQENNASFANARGDLPFIIVTPCVSSNGNDPNELQAVLDIVKEVQKDAHGREKFFISGCSAGGHLTWQLILMHPELLAGAAPSACNFRSRGITTISQAKERNDLPIHGFQGDKDGILEVLNQQWKDAEQTARSHGFKNITRTIVPGEGHQPFPRQVVVFCAEVLAGKATSAPTSASAPSQPVKKP